MYSIKIVKSGQQVAITFWRTEDRGITIDLDAADVLALRHHLDRGFLDGDNKP